MKNLQSIKITAREEINEELVYDITVPGDHNFFLNGVLSSNCFILLDEAQNTTVEQMKMFLTRLGYDSKMVVNGDISQSDLPKGMESGLSFAHDRLVGSDGEIGCVEFTSKHIVRNPLIAKMLQYLDGPGKKPEPVVKVAPVRHSFYDDKRVA